MAEAKAKPCEEDSVIIEEEKGILEKRVEQISPSKNEKRKREDEEDGPNRSSNKYKHTADGNRTAVTTNSSSRRSLTVPFWKNINRRQSSGEIHTREMGTFSLLTRNNEKECFDDKRYLRSKSFA